MLTNKDRRVFNHQQSIALHVRREYLVIRTFRAHREPTLKLYGYFFRPDRQGNKGERRRGGRTTEICGFTVSP